MSDIAIVRRMRATRAMPLTGAPSKRAAHDAESRNAVIPPLENRWETGAAPRGSGAGNRVLRGQDAMSGSRKARRLSPLGEA